MEIKVISRKRYTNKNTGKITSVICKTFFNVQHVDGDSQTPRYTHYKTFLKNWVRCEDVQCSKCGDVVEYDTEDNILFHVQSQKYVILCNNCRLSELIV